MFEEEEMMRRSLVAYTDDDSAEEEEEQQAVGGLHNASELSSDMGQAEMEDILDNFTRMSILFSVNHGCVVACLTLATARLGALGAWQSGLLYMAYTLSALLGSASLVQYFGSRTSMMIGMGLYGLYVGCFVLALQVPAHAKVVAYAGALLGGSGAGCLWTAQGAYFSHAADAYDRVSKHLKEQDDNSSEMSQWWDQMFAGASCCACYCRTSSSQKSEASKQSQSTGTTKLAGIFAFWYLAAEVAMRLLSSVVLEWDLASWKGIFSFYTFLTALSAIGMLQIKEYGHKTSIARRHSDDDILPNEISRVVTVATTSASPPYTTTWWHKATTTLRLLRYDSKMKYLVGLNAVFGLTSAFVNTYVNGEVVGIVLRDPDSKYIGVLTSYTSGVAAVMSLIFAKIAPYTGRGFVLIAGALAFAGVVLPFVVQPNITTFRDSSILGWSVMLAVYGLMGIGRATFEGTLKATFADYFPYEKEGAFANIILQNGFFTSLSYVLTFLLPCDKAGAYCVEYSDGSTLFVLAFEILVLAAALAAILGYLRASRIHQRDQDEIGVAQEDEEAFYASSN